MLYRTLVWRRLESIDEIQNERMDPVAAKMVFSDGTDKESQPLCYNLYGELHDADFYSKVFGTEESREEFVRRRIQILEKVIRTGFKLGPNMPYLDLIPEFCREVTAEWNKEVLNLGEILMGMLSEGLGLSVERLKEMTCLEAREMVGPFN